MRLVGHWAGTNFGITHIFRSIYQRILDDTNILFTPIETGGNNVQFICLLVL